MAYALNIRSDDTSAGYVKSLWNTFSILEKQPSMEAMGYAPHITFAIYDDIGSSELYDTFEIAFGHLHQITVQFTELRHFEGRNSIVLWAAPALPDDAIMIHERIHSMLSPDLCYQHYRPESWVPHCSLATSIDLTRKQEVLEIVNRRIDPFEVVFNIADCVSFLPVVVLRERMLSNWPNKKMHPDI